MTTWIEGIDAAWGRPTPAQLTAAGKHFIVGYVSHDPAKNLSRDECRAYLDAGIAVGLVWETTATRALSGALAGADDGREARRQAAALGFPLARPIFVAVDFDATAAQLAAQVGPYLLAFGTTVGGVALAGVYGGLAVVRYALDHKLVGWGWQTYAWSTAGTTVARMRADPHNIGWDTRAYAQQYHNGVSIAGHDTDLDRAMDLTGLWTKEGTDMTAPTAQDNAHELMTGLQANGAGWTGKPRVSAGTDLGDGADAARAAKVTGAANATALAALKAAVIEVKTDVADIAVTVKDIQEKLAAAGGGTVDVAALAEALRPVVAEELARLQLTVTP